MLMRDRYQFIAAMTQRGVSCRELAKWADCSFQFISQLRTGQDKSCTPALAARIEKALGVAPGFLFEPRSPARAPESYSGGRDASRVVA